MAPRVVVMGKDEWLSSPSSFDISDLQRELESIGDGLKDGRLPLWVYNNREIFELEMDRIFSREWVFIGHESEVPNHGDYAQRSIAGDPFIFVRDERGQVQVLFNSCCHRGTQVTRLSQGNTSHFRCPFHGWTYDNSGNLVGVPYEEQAYPEMNKHDIGLQPAPRVDSYKGLVFASLSPDGPSLENHLGEFTWYLDMHLDLADGGVEVIGEPLSIEVDIDWKQRPEQGYGDNYHTAFTHQSALLSGVAGTDEVNPNEKAYIRNVGCGRHGMNLYLVDPKHDLYLGHDREAIDPENNLDEEQHRIIRRLNVCTGVIFPNTTFIHQVISRSEDTPPCGAFLLRKWQPIGPGRCKQWLWVLAPKEASDEYKAEVRKAAMMIYGQFEPDDIAVWSSSTAAAGSTFARLSEATLDYSMGKNVDRDREIDDDLDHDSWPGEVFPYWLDESYARHFYQSWYKTIASA